MGVLGDGVSLGTTLVDRGAPCGSRRMDVGWVTGVEGTWVPGVHSNCEHNERSALTTRTLGPVPPQVHLEPGAPILRVWSRLRGLARRFPGEKWTHLTTALSYHGALRRRYLAAEESLRGEWVRGRDARLKPFLKAEKVWCGAKRAKPRMICPRDPRYNLAVASRLKPLEHWLWGRLTLSSLYPGMSKSRLVLKGLSPMQRATVLRKKFDSFDRCVVFEIDGKGFEAHVGRPALSLEHSVYKSAFPGDPGLNKLLSYQLDLGGKTMHGIKFRRSGGRASGDFNTGMGNSLVMVACVVGALRTFRVPFDLAVDGDNALVFLPGQVAGPVVTHLPDRILATSGQEITLESPVTIFESVRFGQSAPVLGPGGRYTMVRDYRAVLSKASATHRYGRELRGFRRYLKGVAECELWLGRGLPVVQAWASRLLVALYPLERLGDQAYRDWYLIGARHAALGDAVPVSEETRNSFALAFGMSPDAQRSLELELTRTDLQITAGECVEVPSGCWWDATPGIAEPWAEARQE